MLPFNFIQLLPYLRTKFIPAIEMSCSPPRKSKKFRKTRSVNLIFAQCNIKQKFDYGDAFVSIRAPVKIIKIRMCKTGSPLPLEHWRPPEAADRPGAVTKKDFSAFSSSLLASSCFIGGGLLHNCLTSSNITLVYVWHNLPADFNFRFLCQPCTHVISN